MSVWVCVTVQYKRCHWKAVWERKAVRPRLPFRARLERRPRWPLKLSAFSSSVVMVPWHLRSERPLGRPGGRRLHFPRATKSAAFLRAAGLVAESGVPCGQPELGEELSKLPPPPPPSLSGQTWEPLPARIQTPGTWRFLLFLGQLLSFHFPH